jgi:hypothetical protein
VVLLGTLALNGSTVVEPGCQHGCSAWLASLVLNDRMAAGPGWKLWLSMFAWLQDLTGSSGSKWLHDWLGRLLGWNNNGWMVAGPDWKLWLSVVAWLQGLTGSSDSKWLHGCRVRL